jgi:hypothetical protein
VTGLNGMDATKDVAVFYIIKGAKRCGGDEKGRGIYKIFHVWVMSILFFFTEMMIWFTQFLALIYLVAMYMTVFSMVIDTQDLFAVRKCTFPVIGRGF